MIDFSQHFHFLKTTDLASLARRLEETVAAKQAAQPNADIPRWCQYLETLPKVSPSDFNYQTGRVTLGRAEDLEEQTSNQLKETLLSFNPWRKGPFELFGIHIDSEWRSDFKWARLENKIAPLQDKLVLDVGSGNGYYLYRMLGQRAQAVIGVDPTWLSVMQFQAINHFAQEDRINVLPLGVEDLPMDCACFDTVFSMGILYHRRDPQAHLRDLKGFLKPGGQLVLETIVMDVPEEVCFVPEGRYAKMRNVWAIASPPMLESWLHATGFDNIQLIDVSPTTVEEQRPTEWMTWESLPNFLDPTDSTKTIEGHPAPIRGLVVANKA